MIRTLVGRMIAKFGFNSTSDKAYMDKVKYLLVLDKLCQSFI